MDAVKLWKQIREEYQKKVKNTIYQPFIEPLEAVAIIDDQLMLLAPGGPGGEFIKIAIYGSHKEALEKIAYAKYGKRILLRIATNIEEIQREFSQKTEQKNESSGLIAKYTFDNFVIGNSNRFAHAACVAVAESPAKAYNPLFIYGGVGLGKTHLMHAIAHHILSQMPSTTILYLSSETFTNELINSIKDDKNVEFREKYRNVDVLLIDDIQFIAGKESTQEEFFHTFNALHSANKQIIISSDRPPREIPTLEDRLRSRFEMGLIADIQSPDYETRIAILRKKAQDEKVVVPDEVMAHIAKNIKANIRELEGALVRIFAFAELTRKPITYELACDALKDIFQNSAMTEITCSIIKEKVAVAFSIKKEDFQSKKRTREVAFPRQVAMYLCRELTKMSLPKIGEEFGGRDHTTVIHACEKIAKDMQENPKIKEKVDTLLQDLQN